MGKPRGPMSEAHRRKISLTMKKNNAAKKRAAAKRSGAPVKRGRPSKTDSALTGVIQIPVSTLLANVPTAELVGELAKRV